MAQFKIIAQMASGPITYLYEDPAKASAKLRTLQRNTIPFELRDGVSGAPLSVDAVRELAAKT